MRILLLILLQPFISAQQCLNKAQCDQLKLSYPIFSNIDSNCEINIGNVNNCIIYCAQSCSYPLFSPGIVSKYHYKPKSNTDINVDNTTVKTNCNVLSLSLRNATNFI